MASGITTTAQKTPHKSSAVAVQAFPSRLVEKEPQGGDIVSFRFERPREYEFKAGQWFVVSFAGPSGPYDHHFSHSNSPREPQIEFTTRMRGTEFKNALDALPIGAMVEIEGPYGSFTLEDECERVAFITGGIGITCVRSILRWLAGPRDSSRHAPARTSPAPSQIVVVDANHSRADIPFRDELEEMQTTLPALRVVHVLSNPDADWQGRRGHVDEEALRGEIEQPRLWRYYVCGPPSLCGSMRQLLLGMGIDREAIRLERFDGYE
jgi:glycine betaine catabolism B